MMDELARKRGGAGRELQKKKMTQPAAVMWGVLGNRTCGDLITERVLQR